MKIEEDTKLDFDDVLIRPQRSTLKSRQEIELTREDNKPFKFKWSSQTWNGTPIIAANMTTVGTFEMAKALTGRKMLTCIHKYYSAKEWIDVSSKLNPEYVMPSIGVKRQDLTKFKKIYQEFPTKFLAVDVANGYGQYLPQHIKKIRKLFPDIVLIAGNVVTADMTQELILAGADVVKIGIGPGCFISDTKVLTRDGLKNIQDIKVGDEVISHSGSYNKVTNTFKYKEEKKIISVNGIKSTLNHEYYVVDKKDKHLITDDNIHLYAKWVKAKDLDKEKHLLLKAQ